MPISGLPAANVAFDHAAANDFVDAANRALVELERATSRRWSDGRRALERCVGPFADHLADELRRRCQEGASLLDELAAARDRVLAAQAEAEARRRDALAAQAASEHQAQIDRGDLIRAGRA
jgi:hypothetical protein